MEPEDSPGLLTRTHRGLGPIRRLRPRAASPAASCFLPGSPPGSVRTSLQSTSRHIQLGRSPSTVTHLFAPSHRASWQTAHEPRGRDSQESHVDSPESPRVAALGRPLYTVERTYGPTYVLSLIEILGLRLASLSSPQSALRSPALLKVSP